MRPGRGWRDEPETLERLLVLEVCCPRPIEPDGTLRWAILCADAAERAIVDRRGCHT